MLPPNFSLGLFSNRSGSVFNCYGGLLLSYHIHIERGVTKIREKGRTKRVGKPNLWGQYEENVPKELKEMVYEQYYSEDLSVYCDGSSKRRLMSVWFVHVYKAQTSLSNRNLYIHQ